MGRQEDENYALAHMAMVQAIKNYYDASCVIHMDTDQIGDNIIDATLEATSNNVSLVYDKAY